MSKDALFQLWVWIVLAVLAAAIGGGILWAAGVIK
jgi:hypothetical protein